MDINRRQWLATAGATLLAANVRAATTHGAGMGVVIHSFAVRGAVDKSLSDPIRFLDHAKTLGSTGVQVGLGRRDAAGAAKVKEHAEAAGMYLEGIASLPADASDVDRFAAEMETARLCGAMVVRTVMLKGRRYETFDTKAAFDRFAEQALASLKLAAPIAKKHGVRLAVENHKDWRAEELLDVLKKVDADPEFLGVCLDTGNSMALLEDPHEVVETLAPRAFTTHFKDMAVEESADGFLLSEVPLGEGTLDLPRVVATLRKHRPDIRFNLEMITRDPLSVPCLSDRYWATLGDTTAPRLARMLRYVKSHASRSPLPRIGALNPDGRLRAEDAQIAACFAFVHDRLGL